MNWKLLYEYTLKNGNPKWGKNCEIENWIPEPFISLYKEYDPISVELSYDFNSLNMIPYKELSSTLVEYELDCDSLVFATCNGDPYFVNNSKVYTFMHGIKKPAWELLSESVEDFFTAIING